MKNVTSSIKSWASEDRPREKMLLKGKDALSPTELMAILIGSGTRSESAFSLAQRILAASGGLHELGGKPLEFFTRFKGMGSAKAVRVLAALELGRRRALTSPVKKAIISSSQDAYRLIGPVLADLGHEEFWIACLNRRNQHLSNIRVSSGGLSSTIVDPKIIFNKALAVSASSIILFHNHPSGNTRPSQEDLRLTEKLCKAGNLLDIKVLDHLIIAHEQYYSFTDEGLI